MSHLLPLEEWGQNRPKQIAYLCGVMKDEDSQPPPTDTLFPARAHDKTKASAVEFLRSHLLYLLPECKNPQGDFDWSFLHADGTEGEDRLASQYWRANIDPSERYVLAVAGSTKYRLPVDGSGFKNLVLAGDWLLNGLNTPGCIETSVISGRQAARH